MGNGTFDREAALLMLNFSRVTYCDEPAIQNWTCPACGNLPGFEAAFVSHERWRHVGCYVGYDKSRDYIVVAFRGTEYLANWVQDLEYIKMDGDYQECDKAAEKAALESGVDSGDNAWLGGGALSRVARTLGLHRAKRKCKVHSGFNEDWKSVREEVVKAVLQIRAAHPSAEVHVTGHSLGGALALLCAAQLSRSLNSTEVRLVTFGEPRVGNVFFAEFINQRLPLAIRLVHQDDVVPHLPPNGRSVLLLTDFRHHATEVWQTGSKDDTFVPCDSSGEDPKCSNSLPRWDRSVEAHRWYLGEHMGCINVPNKRGSRRARPPLEA